MTFNNTRVKDPPITGTHWPLFEGVGKRDIDVLPAETEDGELIHQG